MCPMADSSRLVFLMMIAPARRRSTELRRLQGPNPAKIFDPRWSHPRLLKHVFDSHRKRRERAR